MQLGSAPTFNTDDTTFYSCFNSKSNRFDKVELAADLKKNNDLQTFIQCGKKQLVNFNALKPKLLSFNQLREPFLTSIILADAKPAGK